MTPPRSSSLPRKMFSVIDSSGMSASSWWMIDDAGVLAVTDVAELHSSPLEDDLAGVGAVRVHPAETFISVDLPAPFSPQIAWISPARTARMTSGERLDAGELLGDRPHLEDGLGDHRRPPPAARNRLSRFAASASAGSGSQASRKGCGRRLIHVRPRCMDGGGSYVDVPCNRSHSRPMLRLHHRAVKRSQSPLHNGEAGRMPRPTMRARSAAARSPRPRAPRARAPGSGAGRRPAARSHGSPDASW